MKNQKTKKNTSCMKYKKTSHFFFRKKWRPIEITIHAIMVIVEFFSYYVGIVNTFQCYSNNMREVVANAMFKSNSISVNIKNGNHFIFYDFFTCSIWLIFICIELSIIPIKFEPFISYQFQCCCQLNWLYRQF